MPSEYEPPPDPADPQTRADLRDHAAGLIRDLIRARRQQEPDWPDAEIRIRWGLKDVHESAPVITLLRRVRQRVNQFEATYLNTTGSFPYFSEEDGSSPERQFYDLLAAVTGFVDVSGIDKALKDLPRQVPVDWEVLADWNLLTHLRELLDVLPESTADSGRVSMRDGRFFFNRKIIKDLTPQKQIFLRCVVAAKNQTISLQHLCKEIYGSENPEHCPYKSTQHNINVLLTEQQIPWRLSVPRGSEQIALVPRKESKNTSHPSQMSGQIGEDIEDEERADEEKSSRPHIAKRSSKNKRRNSN